MSVRHYQDGLSYVEVLLAVLIIAISVIPATNALRGSVHSAAADTDATINHYRILGRLEDVLAEPFSTVAAQAAGLAVPTAYSDAAGSADRRLVYISGYDADNADSDNDPFTGTDPGLLLVRVEIEGTVNVMQSLKAEQ